MPDFDDLWSLNPSGDIDKAKRMWGIAIDNTDPEIIIDKYRQYIELWKVTIGIREAKYISGKDQLKDPAMWLATDGYKMEYVMPKNNLMMYMGLNYCSPDELQASYERFKKKVSKKE